MNKTNTFDILLIVVLIAAYASFIIKVCIDLKIYDSCYNKPSTEFYNNHEKLCKKYEDY